MKKSTSKQQTTMVVVTNETPGAPPAVPPQPDYGDFDRFVAKGKRIARTWNELCDNLAKLDDALDTYKERRCDWPVLQEAVTASKQLWHPHDREQQFKADYLRWEAERRSVFDPDALYDRTENHWCIKRRVVVEKLALLIGSFPNAGPHNPETYCAMLTNEILVANPTVIQLEHACRVIRRAKNFPPTIKEMLETLEKAYGCNGVPNDDEVDWLFDEFRKKSTKLAPRWRRTATIRRRARSRTVRQGIEPCPCLTAAASRRPGRLMTPTPSSGRPATSSATATGMRSPTGASKTSRDGAAAGEMQFALSRRKQGFESPRERQ
jgi:hypothetical protein